MIEIRLEQQDWNQVLQVLSQAPWNVANPLILKIGEQLRLHQATPPQTAGPRPNVADDQPPTREH
jgi:hypothetical protein